MDSPTDVITQKRVKRTIKRPTVRQLRDTKKLTQSAENVNEVAGSARGGLATISLGGQI